MNDVISDDVTIVHILEWTPILIFFGCYYIKNEILVSKM